MFRVARKIRVGRETGNTHIFFFGLSGSIKHCKQHMLNRNGRQRTFLRFASSTISACSSKSIKPAYSVTEAGKITGI